MSFEVSPEARALPAPLFGVMSLPEGSSQGFVTVTLGYVLTHHGFSVAAVAGLVSLYLLPSSWKFLFGPILDMSLTPRLWYLLATGSQALVMLAFALTPLTPQMAPLIAVLTFLLAVGSNTGGTAKIAVVGVTIPQARRGAYAGWLQAGNLGGMGLGGGAGLWLATHAGGSSVASGALAAAFVLCALPMLWVRIPAGATSERLTVQATELGRGLLRLARTRTGGLAMVAVVLPLGLGAAAGLLPAVAGDWKASATLVAVVTGMAGGLVAVPGCIAGGYLCGRFAPRTMLMASGVICAVGEAGMAFAPHTPAMFAAFVLGNNLLLGASWAAVSAVMYEALPLRGAATVGSVLASLTNVPVVAITALVGLVQVRGGSSAMLTTEAGLAVAAVAAYSLLAWLWRPAPQMLATVAAAA
jgi:PAT family beta-lactamase induction signal transducer AmpG